MTKPKHALDPRTQSLLELVAETIDTLGVDYAVGGAVAMAAYGYRRNTSDVNLFAHEDDQPRILRALRAGGATEIEEVFRPFHYVARNPEHDNPEIRIDVLFPASDPELSAIEFPERHEAYGKDRRTQRPSQLAIALALLLALGGHRAQLVLTRHPNPHDNGHPELPKHLGLGELVDKERRHVEPHRK